ncbi:MAG: glycosyl hydrolase family 28 protein [Armatimonadota bacterium]
MSKFFSAIILLGLSTMSNSFASIITYNNIPDAVADSPYEVIADGVIVPIEKAGAYNGCYYARFLFEDTARVEVNIKSTAKVVAEVKPEKFRTNFNYTDDGFAFDVIQSGPRVITCYSGSRELWNLIIFAQKESDFKQSPRTDSNTIFISKYTTSDSTQTANIQKALDECHSNGGGLVVFEPGVYITGPLNIKSNTNIYLSPGSIIKSSLNPDDYKIDFEGRELVADAPVSSCHALVNFIHSKNSSIFGAGVIEGQGHIIRNEHGLKAPALQIVDSENIDINDVILRNPATWTFHILRSNDIKIDNLKILTDWSVGNTDGINPDSSSNISISNYFGYCGDDAFAVKTTRYQGSPKPSKNIHIKDSLVMTRKTAFKIGTETHADISDVYIENVEAVNSARGIAIWLNDGSNISNINYNNLTLDLREYVGESMSGEPLRFAIGSRTGIGKLSDITIDNMNVKSPGASVISGKSESKITNFTIKNYTHEITPRGDRFVPWYLFNISDTDNLIMDNINIKWLSFNQDLWLGFIKEENTTNTQINNFNEENR